MSYQPKIYRNQGGTTLTVSAGGTINATAGSVLLPYTALKQVVVAGNNGSASLSTAGTVVGDKVLYGVGYPNAATGSAVAATIGTASGFERTITTVDKLFQNATTDLSGYTWVFTLAPQA